MQSVICTSTRALSPKNVSCILVDFYSLLFVFSPQYCKHRLSSIETAFWKNIASMSTESAIWCSPKQKLIPIRLCNSSGPDRTLSFRAIFWYFAAGLHSLVFAGWWQDEVASSIVAFLWFRSTQPVGLWGHDQPWRHCQWSPNNAFERYQLSVGVVGIWVARCQSRNYLVTLLPLLAIEVQFRFFHRWIELFAPIFFLLSVCSSSDRWHHNLRRRI